MLEMIALSYCFKVEVWPQRPYQRSLKIEIFSTFSQKITIERYNPEEHKEQSFKY